MAVSSLEERQRKGRNVMLASLVLLVFIWTIRIAFPSALTINLDRFTPSTTNSKSNSPQEGNTKSVELAENAEHSSVHKASTSMADGFTSFDASFNGTLGSKVAVIVSSQFRTPVIPLVLRFSSVLGGGWPVIIYTSAESASSFATSAALSRYLATGLIQIRTLPQTTLLNNRADYTDFMVSSYLWEDLAPAENILLFHSDSILCANAARSVDDYFEYDFVGFPPAVLDENYTGGLSLRKRSTMLRVLEPYEEVQGETATPKWTDDKKFHFEDQWFYARSVIHPLQMMQTNSFQDENTTRRRGE